MMQEGFLLYLALGFLATPVLASLWVRRRERLQLRRAPAAPRTARRR